MLAFLEFLQDYEMVCYYLLGLAALWYLFRFVSAQVRLINAKFGLEREILQSQRNGAAGRLLLLALGAAAVFLSIRYGLPEAQKAEALRNNAGAASLPTATPTPTPFILFNVDVSGCVNPKATILRPKPADTVTGDTEVRIVADIPDFAYFVLELGRPDEPDVWVILFTGNLVDDSSQGTPSATEGLHLPATAEEPFSWIWDSSTVLPGVYHLRLTVVAADQDFPPPCVIPIQVLAPPLG
jgi:hypothetical protein